MLNIFSVFRGKDFVSRRVVNIQVLNTLSVIGGKNCEQKVENIQVLNTFSVFRGNDFVSRKL